ncbi:MAG: amino acid ABC transporter substrate-binding protein, partial [Lachnospiraceae bacterium]|nr:amino acid ABC transporter substrate-binding protein [Lachnospiraceae bacterium]
MKKKIFVIGLLIMTLAFTGCSSDSSSDIKSADDLVGKVIGTQLGTTGEIFAGDIENATVEKYNKGADAIQA